MDNWIEKYAIAHINNARITVSGRSNLHEKIIPSKRPKRITAEEYAVGIERMCDANLFHGMCSQTCPIKMAIGINAMGCKQWIQTHPKQAVAVVKEWIENNTEE